jgi:hypothetical protein
VGLLDDELLKQPQCQKAHRRLQCKSISIATFNPITG